MKKITVEYEEKLSCNNKINIVIKVDKESNISSISHHPHKKEKAIKHHIIVPVGHFCTTDEYEQQFGSKECGFGYYISDEYGGLMKFKGRPINKYWLERKAHRITER